MQCCYDLQLNVTLDISISMLAISDVTIALRASKGQGEALPQLTLDLSHNLSSRKLLESLAMGVSGFVVRGKLAILKHNGLTLLTCRTEAFSFPSRCFDLLCASASQNKRRKAAEGSNPALRDVVTSVDLPSFSSLSES